LHTNTRLADSRRFACLPVSQRSGNSAPFERIMGMLKCISLPDHTYLIRFSNQFFIARWKIQTIR